VRAVVEPENVRKKYMSDKKVSLSEEEQRQVREGVVSGYGIVAQAPSSKRFYNYLPLAAACAGVVGVLGVGIYRFVKPGKENPALVQARWMGYRVLAQGGALLGMLYFGWSMGRLHRERNPALAHSQAPSDGWKPMGSKTEPHAMQKASRSIELMQPHHTSSAQPK